MSYICDMQILYAIILFVALTAVLAFLIRRIAKSGLKAMERIEKKVSENQNPYIQYQKVKDANDKQYQEYLEWMQKNSDGVPVDKATFAEDVKADKKIKGLF